ncbi:MAG: 6-phosphogluconolactonase [Endomicrobiales bacterium]
MGSLELQQRSVRVFDDMHALGACFSVRLNAAAERALRRGRVCTLVLAGGRTPVPLYEEMSKAPEALPWERTAVYWGDEKWAPPEDPRSNYRTVNEHLLHRCSIPIADGFASFQSSAVCRQLTAPCSYVFAES